MSYLDQLREDGRRQREEDRAAERERMISRHKKARPHVRREQARHVARICRTRKE